MPNTFTIYIVLIQEDEEIEKPVAKKRKRETTEGVVTKRKKKRKKQDVALKNGADNVAEEHTATKTKGKKRVVKIC